MQGRRRIKLSIMGSCLAIRLLEGDVRASHDDSHDGLREVGNVKRAEHGFRIVFLQVWMRCFGDYNVRITIVVARSVYGFGLDARRKIGNGTGIACIEWIA